MENHPADPIRETPAPSHMDLDHLYRETVHWDASVGWWQRLGFVFDTTWGEPPHRAGSLVRGSARVVLAEVPDGTPPSATTFLGTDDLDDVAERTGSAVVVTHWGTHMVTLEDPDGRTYHFQPKEGA